jgi:membrane protease YdiL (CAAX protease family)
MALGWYGDLALADLYEKAGQPARAKACRETVQRQCRRTVGAVFGVFGGLGLGALVGFVLGALFLVLYSAGRVRLAGPPQPGPAALLGETFILYLFLAVVGARFAFVPWAGSLRASGHPSLVQISPLLFVFDGVTALSLLWPAGCLWAARRRRAIPEGGTRDEGRGTRDDGGQVTSGEVPDSGPALRLTYHASRLTQSETVLDTDSAVPPSLGAVLGWRTDHLGKDLLWGIGGYLAILPLLGVALVILTVIMRFWLQDLPTPAHPLVPLFAAEPNRWAVVVFAVLGSILAPLIEETLFRGALYGALRQRWGVWASVVVSSAIFSLLHPQLPLGFLPLFILGAGFALLYEIRGSLVPGMVAHALTNGVTLCLLYGLVGT